MMIHSFPLSCKGFQTNPGSPYSKTMKCLLFALLLLCSALCSAQQWLDKKYTYDSTLNVIYGTALNFNGSSDTLRMDIYNPLCDDPSHRSRKPLLVWIHGGSFLAGDKSDASITNLCKQFARRGYVTASINYRLGFVSDHAAWNCNYPNYSCLFASDSAEWIRALYRGIQDGKGAVRYLVNRNNQYRIDTNSVFVAGESAGSCIALGIGLLDTVIERWPQTFSLANAPPPNPNTYNCSYNLPETFPNPSIPRPDLGGIDGNLEPSNINYTIKAIGNNFGALASNLLTYHSAKRRRPDIYSFHQPCDLIVPIDSGNVYAGLSWCMTNGYGCYGIAHTPKVYGSHAISHWNSSQFLGYVIQDDFTTTVFPYSFLLGTASCSDQTNNPCHGYDNSTLRENNLAAFFAPRVSALPICDTTHSTTGIKEQINNPSLEVFPNPTRNKITVATGHGQGGKIVLRNEVGQECQTVQLIINQHAELDLTGLSPGIYFLIYTSLEGVILVRMVVKE